MSETKSFSFPEEIAVKIEQYKNKTRLPASTVALMAFEDFFKRPDVKALLDTVPAPTDQPAQVTN